jgi:hypothetical protein
MILMQENRSIQTGYFYYIYLQQPVLVPLCPPQIPHRLVYNQTQASAVKYQQLTASAMTRP